MGKLKVVRVDGKIIRSRFLENLQLETHLVYLGKGKGTKLSKPHFVGKMFFADPADCVVLTEADSSIDEATRLDLVGMKTEYDDLRAKREAFLRKAVKKGRKVKPSDLEGKKVGHDDGSIPGLTKYGL